MQVFVHEHCTVIAAPVQRDVDVIPKGSHYARVLRAIDSFLKLIRGRIETTEGGAPGRRLLRLLRGASHTASPRTLQRAFVYSRVPIACTGCARSASHTGKRLAPNPRIALRLTMSP
jgi:hypothetical protein